MIGTVLILFTITYLLYKISTKNYDYWEKRGVPFLKPQPFIGNVFEVFAFRTGIAGFFADLYNKYNTPYFGIYVFNKPYLILRSPELIKYVLVKDFNYFTDRSLFCDENIDSISSRHLFLAPNPKWKFLRSKISQAFTIGKIKGMFPKIRDVAEEMNMYVASKDQYQTTIDAKELCAKYATEVAAKGAFGVNGYCFEDENAEFRVIGKKLFDPNFVNSINQTSYFFAHRLVKLFKMPFMDRSISQFLRKLILSTIENREREGFYRNDVIDLMIQLKNENSQTESYKFEGDTIVAQAGQFFTAGLETVSTTMSFTLYELCLHPDIQERLRVEIKEIILKYGELSYEAIQNTKYLDMVICETLRKYPVLPFLDRICLQDYKVPDSDLVIEKGTPVYIPMFGLHHDPEYFPDPTKFNPERFSEENKGTLPHCVYIPFGEGPRICVGERFGLTVCKLGICRLLSEYKLLRCPETPVPVKLEKKCFLLASIVGLPIQFHKSPLIAS